jgi:hypothetical protein
MEKVPVADGLLTGRRLGDLGERDVVFDEFTMHG